MQYITKWAQIDLSPYNNSEITTLEEHIKRKWADISAETAGEQYTPEDIISLIAEIVAAKIDISKHDFVHLLTLPAAVLTCFSVWPTVCVRLLAISTSQPMAVIGTMRYMPLLKSSRFFREDAKSNMVTPLTTLPFKGKERRGRCQSSIRYTLERI